MLRFFVFALGCETDPGEGQWVLTAWDEAVLAESWEQYGWDDADGDYEDVGAHVTFAALSIQPNGTATLELTNATRWRRMLASGVQYPPQERVAHQRYEDSQVDPRSADVFLEWELTHASSEPGVSSLNTLGGEREWICSIAGSEMLCGNSTVGWAFDECSEDGSCPWPDQDADGVADPDDMCPLEAESLNGSKDADGCPE